MPMTERFFNTSGPVAPADRYCIPPLERFDLNEVLRLIRAKRYFVLYAPRQTGKTSALLALRDLLNGSGEYRCLYVNVEVGQSARSEFSTLPKRRCAGGGTRDSRVTFMLIVPPPNDAFGVVNDIS